MHYQQYTHINDIFSRPLEESYQAEVIKDFKWADWVDPTKTVQQPHKRADIRLKGYPYRGKPIEVPK